MNIFQNEEKKLVFSLMSAMIFLFAAEVMKRIGRAGEHATTSNLLACISLIFTMMGFYSKFIAKEDEQVETSNISVTSANPANNNDELSFTV